MDFKVLQTKWKALLDPVLKQSGALIEAAAQENPLELLAQTQNFPATGTTADVPGGPLQLTPGAWELTLMLTISPNNFTGNGFFSCGISTSSGGAFADLVPGSNTAQDWWPSDYPSNSCERTIAVVAYSVTLTSNTNYYAKVAATYGGGPPQYSCRFSARSFS